MIIMLIKIHQYISELDFFIKQEEEFILLGFLYRAGIYRDVNFESQNKCKVKLFFVIIVNLATLTCIIV